MWPSLRSCKSITFHSNFSTKGYLSSYPDHNNYGGEDVPFPIPDLTVFVTLSCVSRQKGRCGSISTQLFPRVWRSGDESCLCPLK